MHSYYANMGGFVLDFTDFVMPPAAQPTNLTEDSENPIDVIGHTVAQPMTRGVTWDIFKQT
jgi:hypothetical protein